MAVLRGGGFLLVSLVLLLPLFVAGQQVSPFEGQGANPPSSNGQPVPVFMSVSLEKLLYVDDTKYQFEAILNVALTWTDPQAQYIINGSSVYVASSLQNQADTFANCSITNPPGGNTGFCQNATQDPYGAKACNRYCSPGASFTCCDALWLPSVDLDNNIYQSQDRFVVYNIYTVGSAVAWQARVHGLFSSPMSFKRFPFDKQNLQFRVSARDPTVVQLLPSQLQKNGAGSATSDLGGARADEIPNWQVDDMAWLPQEASPQNASVEVVRPASPSDPSFQVGVDSTARPGSFGSGISSTQVVIIHVSRQSSFYFWNMVFPVVICVTLSWVAFFVEPTDLEVRLGTSITLLLTITALQFLVNDALPASSYLTAFHRVLLVSYLFISFVVLENLLVYYITRLKEKIEKKGQPEHKRRASNNLQLDVPLATHDTVQEAHLTSLPSGIQSPSVVQSANSKGTKGDLRQTDSTLMARYLSWRKGEIALVNVIKKGHKRFEEDEAWAFRKAGWLDRTCAVIFPLTYYLTVIIVFATTSRNYVD